MIHESFEGAHGDIGFRWGALLAERGQFILQRLGFPLTQERRRFARACLPLYQRFFPEILEEIRGIAEGQRCAPEDIQAFLFSMYAMTPACHCSCFAVANSGGVLFGRNSDFLTALEDCNRHAVYRLPGCSFVGNTTAFVQMEDGVNAHGLAVGLTSVYPHAVRPGLNAGLLLRYFLEKCGTTREVIRQARELPIASAQTFTVADASGEIAVIECNCDALDVLRPDAEHPYVCATNRFHSPRMARFNVPGLDDWQAEPRYQSLSHALARQAQSMRAADACALLSGRGGFLCPYDRATGRDTVWSVVYDLGARQLSLAEGNPCRHAFACDERFPAQS